MATDRKLINYLPLFMQDYFEMQKITDAQQTEVDRLWLEIENGLADQFVMDATENGVKRWEHILGISPKDTDTLDERKFRILAKLNQELPYTLRKLQESLTNLCGVDGYAIELNAAQYHIQVKLALSNENNYQEVVDLLSKMIPANMTQFVQVMYNTHSIVSQFTHGELSVYTHDQIRRDTLDHPSGSAILGSAKLRQLVLA